MTQTLSDPHVAVVILANVVALVALLRRLVSRRRRGRPVSGVTYLAGRAPVLAGDGATLDVAWLDPTAVLDPARDWPLWRSSADFVRIHGGGS